MAMAYNRTSGDGEYQFPHQQAATMNGRRRMNARLSFVVVSVSLPSDKAHNDKGPGLLPGLRISWLNGRLDLEVHPAAARHLRHAAAGATLLRHFGNHRLGGDEQGRDRRCVLQRGAHDLGRVDNALLHHVEVFAALCVEAVAVLILLQDLADDDRAVLARIEGDLAGRRRERLADDLNAGLLIIVAGAELAQAFAGTEQGDAAARQDAFLDRGAGRMHRVINAILALLHLDLGRAADADHRDAAGELGQTLLQLLLVVVRGGFLDLRLDLGNACLDVGLLARAVDDRGVFLVDHHLLGAAEHGERDVLELDAEIFADRLAAGQDCDVLQHRLAAIAEARSLHGRDLEAAAQLVDDEGGESFAFDVFRDDDERLRGLHHRLEQRQQLLEARQLLFVDQDVGVIHVDAHLVGIGDEVRRDVAAVELHALDDFKLGLQALGLFNRDDAFVADPLHGVGEELADFGVAVGRDGADLGDFLVRGDLLGVLLQLRDDVLDREVDAALQIHRVHAGGDRLGAFLHDRLGENGGGGGAVTGEVRGLRGDFAHHLGAHVLELVFELDLLGDGDAVLGDARRAERLVEDDVAALRAERHLDGVGENVDTAKHLVARVDGEFDFLGSHFNSLRC